MCGTCASCKTCVMCPMSRCSDCNATFCNKCYLNYIACDGGQNVDHVYFCCPICTIHKNTVSDTELLKFMLRYNNMDRDTAVHRFKMSKW